MTPSGTQLGTDVRGPRALYFGDIYQDASSISHMVAFHTRLRFLGIPPNILLIQILDGCYAFILTVFALMPR